MEISVEKQRMCAVYEADNIGENEQSAFPKFECYKGDCSAIAEICVDGITNVTGGSCKVLNQGSVFHGSFRKPPTENIV